MVLQLSAVVVGVKQIKFYFCNGIDNDNKLATDELWGPGLEEKKL